MKERKSLPSYEYLHEIFHYNENTGILKWKKSNTNSIKIGDKAGYSITTGHLAVSINNEKYLVHRIIWKMMLNEEPPDEIDHKNTWPNDNRWCNLREALRGENIANSKLYNTNTSGYKGVNLHVSGLWRARIVINYKEILIGYFHSKEEAAKARKEYAIKMRGEFARETLSAEF